MGKRDTRVDAYIAKATDFARPVLTHLREVVHTACPDVQETMKWSHPHFEYKGMLCGMAAFKGHCAFGFWKNTLVVGTDAAAEKAMGQFGRITKPADLPSKKILTSYIKKAMQLNDEGIKAPSPMKSRGPKPELVVPGDLSKALRGSPKAKATFDGFSPSNKREYVEWISEAKTEVTRSRRLETAIEWMTEGKPRNWKYMKC